MSNLVANALKRQLQCGCSLNIHLSEMLDGSIRISMISTCPDASIQTTTHAPDYSSVLDAIGIQILEHDRQISLLVQKESS